MELALRAKNLPKHKNMKNFEKKWANQYFLCFDERELGAQLKREVPVCFLNLLY